MDNVRIWASEGEILDFVVRNEPKYQPCLRSNYPSLDERWKPSATNVDMIPDASAQTLRVKTSLIEDYCMIRLLPYHPQVWIARAATFLELGYGDLAISDAYKAHLICKAASVEEMKAREPGDGSLTAKVFSTILSKHLQSENQSLEAYYQQIFASINRAHANAYLLMAQGLTSMSAWYDARYVLQEAKKAFPENRNFTMMLTELKENITQLEVTLQLQGRDEKAVNEILHGGQLERVTYPWIVAEELEKSVKTVERINTQFVAASTNACLLMSPIGGEPPREGVKEDDFGVYAQTDITRGGAILATKSIWTDCRKGDDRCFACYRFLRNQDVIRLTTCTCVFCSDACRQEALTTYHNAICGRDFGWLYEACTGVGKTYSDLVPLMMIKVLGTAVHLDCKPLKVPCIKALKPNNDSVVPATFRLSYNVIAPIQILETLGVDIFANLKFDSWALQTVIMRIENNRVRKQTRGDLRYSIIHPIFNMFNHSCKPNAIYKYEGGGTAMTVRAARHIKKGEEICVSYIEPWMPEKENKDELWKRLGSPCGCHSCKRERLIQETRLRFQEREAEERRRFLEERRRFLDERAAAQRQWLIDNMRPFDRVIDGVLIRE